MKYLSVKLLWENLYYHACWRHHGELVKNAVRVPVRRRPATGELIWVIGFQGVICLLLVHKWTYDVFPSAVNLNKGLKTALWVRSRKARRSVMSSEKYRIEMKFSCKTQVEVHTYVEYFGQCFWHWLYIRKALGHETS